MKQSSIKSVDFSDYRYFDINDARALAGVKGSEWETGRLHRILADSRKQCGDNAVLWPLGLLNSSDTGCLYLTIQVVFWIYICFFVHLVLSTLATWLQQAEREPSVLFTPANLYMSLAAVILFFLYRFACRKGREQEEVNPDYHCILSRTDQMVYVRNGSGEFEPVPWDQIVLSSRNRATGGNSAARIYYVLFSSPNHKAIYNHDSAEENHDVIIEIYKQFMDPEQPIPDIPRLESFRQLDTVTTAYDSERNRPENLWEKLTDNQIEELWHSPKKFKGEVGFVTIPAIDGTKVKERLFKNNLIYIISVIVIALLFSALMGGTVYQDAVETYGEMRPGFEHWSDQWCYIIGVILELLVLFLMVLPVAALAGFGVMLGIDSLKSE